ncbi:MAG: hypothetical protein Q4G68_06055 [Planctomycetia bacterium]|nr:hypothetical protein [Planctomycetia bacterium]
MGRTRQTISPETKTKVAIEAIQEFLTVNGNIRILGGFRNRNTLIG